MIKLATVSVLLFASAPGATPISAGRWQLSTDLDEVIFDGQRDPSPIPPGKPRMACLSTATATQGPGLAFSDPATRRTVKSRVGNGVYEFETECKATESNDIITTKASGTYTSDRYSGRSVSIQRREGMTIEMRSRMEAKRIGDC